MIDFFCRNPWLTLPITILGFAIAIFFCVLWAILILIRYAADEIIKVVWK